METHRTRPSRAMRPALQHAVLLAGLVLALLAGAARAQSAPTVKAAVDPPEIRPGSYAVYTLTVEGGQPDAAPQLQLPPDLQVAGSEPSYSNQTSIINGVVSHTSVFSWNITARKAGTFTIPAQEIPVGGQPVRSGEVRLVANANAAQGASQYDPLLVVQVEKREIYLGEVIPITVTVYAPERRVAIQRIGLIEVPKDNFAIQRFPLQPEQRIETMGGERYRAYIFRSTVSALKPGKFKLGPAASEILFEVESRAGGAGGRMQHPFFMQTEQRTAKPQSAEIDVTVLPLPTQDRPPGFKGLVGDFELSLNADPHELSVGDPISVELSVSGAGNFDSLAAPALSRPDGWKMYPARRLNVRQPDPTGETIEQRATFNQVIIPTKMIAEIPPFEFSFFSPTKKQYITARTAPVPIRVKEGAKAPAPKAPVATTSGEAPSAEPEKVNQPPVKLTDIVTVLPESAAWITPRPVLGKERTFLLWNGAAAGAVLLLLAIRFGLSLWRSRATSGSAPLRALGKELRAGHLSRGAFYQAAAHYIRLAGLQPNPERQDVLARHEQINFSPAQTAAAEPVPAEERARVLRALQA